MLIYFSQTGNTQLLAQAIKRMLKIQILSM